MTSVQLMIVNVFAAIAVSFLLSLFFARRHRNAGKREAKAETLRLLRAEFLYWSASGDATGADLDQRVIAMAAMGAVSNVLAAVVGSPAPWHAPDYEVDDVAEVKSEVLL